VRRGLWLYPGVSARELVEAVRIGEACGLDEIWIADEGVGREPFSLLAAAAMVTSRITLAVGITSPLLRHPGALAATAATVDELSSRDESGTGRIILGLGIGGTESLDPFGIEISRPIAEMDRAITVCRGVLQRRSVPGYSLPDHAMPARNVPIWVGARGPQMIRLAARRTDGVFISGCTRDQVISIVNECSGVGRDPLLPHLGIALYHSASDQISAPTVSSWNRAAADLVELIADHPVTSIGINLVDLATTIPPALPRLVEKGAELLAEVVAQVSTRAAP
jgi:alkanesulfonate monooxygenase SsuD/methylene tetrahydromethanopterin reductase-like flavin-dependent oxidoreductase (luciferase family)